MQRIEHLGLHAQTGIEAIGADFRHALRPYSHRASVRSARQLKWDELDEKTRTWIIPGRRTKNKRAHIVHLSEPAWKAIQ
ncbi:MAG: hypothetical protein ACXWJ8_11470, partial [Xanthobacteraceae bacterium]